MIAAVTCTRGHAEESDSYRRSSTKTDSYVVGTLHVLSVFLTTNGLGAPRLALIRFKVDIISCRYWPSGLRFQSPGNCSDPWLHHSSRWRQSQLYSILVYFLSFELKNRTWQFKESFIDQYTKVLSKRLTFEGLVLALSRKMSVISKNGWYLDWWIRSRESERLKRRKKLSLLASSSRCISTISITSLQKIQ